MNKKQILLEARKVLDIELKSIKSITSCLNQEFYKVINQLLHTKGRVIVTGIGKSGHIANKISATLSSTGTPSHFIHATEASHGDLGGITKNDTILALSNSGQTYELNDIINYSKRFNIPLLSITSNKNSILYKKSNYGIVFKKPLEACPNNLAPTSSTTLMLVIGDAIAVTLIKIKGFKKSQFSSFHPGGNLGKDLVRVIDLMHTKNSLPLVNVNEKMSNVLIKMTKKSFGCIGVINNSKKLVGIITDGDLRKNMNNKLFNRKALELMTKNPTTGDKNMLIGEALNIMNSKKITNLFICEKK